MEYILYKNPIQIDTLTIVQYLHYNGHKATPKYCIERNYPPWVVDLPSIETISEQQRYVGLNNCILFYEKNYDIKDILAKSLNFKNKNPDYCINR